AWTARRKRSPALGGDPAHSSSIEIAVSRREKPWYRIGRYEMTTARKPKPVPASTTVTKRARSVLGTKSAMPSVVKLVPLTYTLPNAARLGSKLAGHLMGAN